MKRLRYLWPLPWTCVGLLLACAWAGLRGGCMHADNPFERHTVQP